MKIFEILCIISLSILYGCKGLTDRRITDRYYLVTMETKENVSIAYSINDDNTSFLDVVKPCVYSIGYNDKYILAKQHPLQSHNNVNTSITNYYIIPIYKEFNYSPEKEVIGPLTLEQFNLKRKVLMIPNEVIFQDL
ncbi:DUF3997 domain-containing protein [Solitalea canadensis]|uniref:Lipoprotein n=1 Tax=Solitalea canadensis (strain ATCC 29591 / DSM 3403 / JCM 21819 / LMG 8368 / NBRC 15130 / NCIMB 12057 / USAM 9D) TaxID=929556 RepID=H8KVT0_SOLCM|nr:DUF3997 domain-containing protein [Solitalea canadensis]AFD06703.1 hypothetical protein Solca_1636 [Solitalea canadensis DSM 3403]